MKYWTREYKLDGFRIDQMGLWDVTTLNQVRAGVSSVEPTATIIGEGWTMGPSIGVPQGTQRELVNMPGIGAFNDVIRNAVKGDPDGAGLGFVNGSAGPTLESVKVGTIGNTPSDAVLVPWETSDAGQSVNYVEAHDNKTLFDKLNSVSSDGNLATLGKQVRQSGALVVLSQGTPFIHAGQEFLRTKNDEANSYNLSDSVNSLKWGQRATYASTVAYYKGLIALRKSHKAFRMNTPVAIAKNLKFLNAPNNVLAYSINGKAAGDSWSTVVVISNPNASAQKVTLPASGNWIATVLGDKAGVSTLATYKGTKSVTVAANSTLVIHK
jgi:pullulanase